MKNNFLLRILFTLIGTFLIFIGGALAFLFLNWVFSGPEWGVWLMIVLGVMSLVWSLSGDSQDKDNEE